VEKGKGIAAFDVWNPQKSRVERLLAELNTTSVTCSTNGIKVNGKIEIFTGRKVFVRLSIRRRLAGIACGLG